MVKISVGNSKRVPLRSAFFHEKIFEYDAAFFHMLFFDNRVSSILKEG